ncbi:MAG TPA: thiamine phosphate synthase [Blastocatellia bacterium]|nr:thiamine phosphate synthase [Blastocatellia bacterium]
MRNLQTRPLIYLITDRCAFLKHQLDNDDAQEGQLKVIGIAAESGCHLVQIRERNLSARELADFVSKAINIARPHGTRTLVNDRLDVALATGADGVHLRTNSIAVSEARRIADAFQKQDSQNSFLIGVSTHSLDEALKAEREGADFIVCSPVYKPISKPAHTSPLGLEGLREICTKVKIPVLALGGISIENFGEPLLHGAAGIAGIGLFQDSNNLRTHLKMMLSFRL